MYSTNSKTRWINGSAAIRRGSWRLLVTLAAFSLVAGACGGGETADTQDSGAETGGNEATDTADIGDPTDGNEGPSDPVVIDMPVSPSGLPVYVAADQGLFPESVELNVSKVGFSESAALFAAGEAPLGWIAPLEVAIFVSEGEDMRYFDTAGASNMINGVAIRAEDADKYQTLEDLKGQKFGNPGFGSGTWVTFEVVADAQYEIDARSDFDLVNADSGAALGLLERGEIEAALIYPAQAAAVHELPQFEMMFNFSADYEEQTGVPLVANGPVARNDWLEENAEVLPDIIAGIDAGVQWIEDNPDEVFEEDGLYADWARDYGWLADQEVADGTRELLAQGEWFLKSDTYTQEFIDSMYSLVESGQGVLVDEVPAKDEIFFQLDTSE